MSEVPEVFDVFEKKLAQVLSFTLVTHPNSTKKAVEELLTYFSSVVERASKAESRIAELEAAQRWIPVSERLPEANVRVLFCNGNRFAVGWYDTNDDIYEWSCWDDKWPGVTPTHWMPIPQPPEVQE